MSEKNIAIPFIDKAVTKTKNGNLKWGSMENRTNLIRFYSSQESYDPLSATVVYPQTITSSRATPYDYSRSYYAKFRDGYIFLLVSLSETEFYSSPLDKSAVNAYDLFLFAQDIAPSGAKLIAASTSSSEISIQLRRLYNLAKDSALNLDGFIDDFLNS